VARLTSTEGAGEIAERIRVRRGGALRPLDRMLLHSPQVADGWNSLLGAIRQRSVLSDAIRELVILRIAVLNRADYEWVAHEPEARRAGLNDAQLDAIRRDQVDFDSALDDVQRHVIAYTDEMTKEIDVADTVFDSLRPHFSEPELVELTATVAAYNMVSRFVVALQVTVPTAPKVGA
jgi:4-carboxymuconolactone decarboxylase